MPVRTEIRKNAVGEKEYNQLRQNLGRQVEFFDLFIDAGLRLKMALVNNRLADQVSINQEQGKIISKLEKLESDRLNIMKKIIETAGPSANLDSDPQKIHCTDLYPLLGSDDAQILAAIRTELNEKIKHVKRIHEINSILIQNARKITQMTLNIMTGLSGKNIQKKSQVYGAKGRINQNNSQKVRLFNHQA